MSMGCVTVTVGCVIVTVGCVMSVSCVVKSVGCVTVTVDCVTIRCHCIGEGTDQRHGQRCTARSIRIHLHWTGTKPIKDGGRFVISSGQGIKHTAPLTEIYESIIFTLVCFGWVKGIV